ncbi:EcoRI family type II restriction endonuclease [Microcystis aeruginosa]|uniref:EcoRI family type II restriction endonuclease n=1 Tax=Microcystis aeruginosa TaxID=1126 RepID=UPI002330BC56|nr:EcoRI family type II restriction endonuclease [Microcystis aeruginosa]MDB9434413.1 EcoRI family type II restriction endonuclease [Microcystis aeruginosa CS-552/01]
MLRYRYSGKRLSEIQTKLCLAWFIARDTVPHTTAHRYAITRPRNNCASLLIKKMFDIMLEISKTSLQVLGSEIFNQITKSK